MEEKSFQTQVLWDKNSGVQGRLREPRLQTGAAPLHTPNESTAKTTTVLNVDAPEFVPRNLGTSDVENQIQNVHITVDDGPQYISKHNAQSRLDKLKTSNQRNEQTSSSSSNSKEEIKNGYSENNISTDLIRLKQIISSLIMYPGQFDDLLMVFMETIFPYFNNILAMSQIAELLVSQAINCPNFRYNGARLCWYLEQKCPEFRAEIHMRCTKQLQENLNQQNLVLFIAELYTQLPHDSVYGALLINSLKKLMNEGGDNIKCVCQALKLTGYSLEGNHSAALDDLFGKLSEFKNSLSGSALILLNSVINLRESNWGRTSNEGSNSDSSDYDHYEDMVNGIIYETDGETLTNEEQEFLITNATHDEYISDEEDPDALCDPEPEMDEEIQAAFEEFVKFSKG